MRNIKLTASRWAIVATTALLCSGAAATMATSASATPIRPVATTACGAKCVDVSFVSPGRHYILKDHSALTNPNNVIALTRGSNAQEGQDFSATGVGSIVPIYCTATGQAEPGSEFTNRQCQLLVGNGYGPDTAYQLAYNPNQGGPETMCIGAWNNVNTVPSGWKMRLEPCGVNADTVLIVAQKLPDGAVSDPGSFWLINGGSDNFSNPLAATNNGGVLWQAPTWKTVETNGSTGEDVQEVRAVNGPF